MYFQAFYYITVDEKLMCPCGDYSFCQLDDYIHNLESVGIYDNIPDLITTLRAIYINFLNNKTIHQNGIVYHIVPIENINQLCKDYPFPISDDDIDKLEKKLQECLESSSRARAEEVLTRALESAIWNPHTRIGEIHALALINQTRKEEGLEPLKRPLE